MSEVSPEYGWWENEPPESPEEEEEFPRDVHKYELERAMEILDGEGTHNLFSDVVITDDNEGLKFRVPTRLIESSEYGSWFLDVKGERRWFKERDDYGEIRVSSNGLSYWVPHLFPFEEVDEYGLPMMLDRERCNVTIVLLQGPDSEGMEEPYPADTLIKSPNGTYFAQEDIESYNPYGLRYFKSFTHQTKTFQPEEVLYPDQKWSTLQDYLIDKGRAEDYGDIMLGNLSIPEEFDEQSTPNEWQARKKHDVVWPVFGSIWVPVDMLRSGTAEATIQFPMFQASEDYKD